MNHKIETKDDLRKSIQGLRDQQANISLLSQSIANTLFSLEEWNRATSICSYASFSSEVETESILKEALRTSKDLYIPWIKSPSELLASKINSLNELEKSNFGIFEPKLEIKSDSTRVFSPDNAELVLVPGIAFDGKGNRLGYGKGFYDRFLAKLSSETNIIALAFELQIIESIAAEKHDFRIPKIITEERIINNKNNLL